MVILGGLIYGVYLITILRQPPSCFDGRQNQDEEEADCGGSCVSCGLKNVRPIATSTPQILEAGREQVSVLVELRNPNLDFGADSFSYVINFYDRSGKLFNSLKGTSFIYAGEIKTIVEPVIALPFAQIGRSEFLIQNISWQPAGDFLQPSVQVRDLQTKKSGKSVVVSGLAFNNNPFKLSRVSVATLVFNNLGLRLGISETLLQDVQPSEQRFFSISIPLGAVQNLDTRLTKVFIEARR